MDVFISWSGERSRLLAEALADLIRRLLHPIKPWMSATAIRKGDRWFSEIGSTLATVTRGIICVTPENQNSPWLLFEAGALAKTVNESRICPVLLGMTPDDLAAPLNQFQATVLNRSDIYNLFKTLNDDLGQLRLEDRILEEEFSDKWPRFESRLGAGLDTISLQAQNSVESVLEALKTNGVPRPEIGVTAYFEDGFESHALYTAATASANSRLWLFGRKNRKLFDKDHAGFFSVLAAKITQGFDFRCLFLRPDAPDHIITAAHEDPLFPRELRMCILNASNILRHYGLAPETHLRGYSLNRELAALVVDEAVLFTPIEHTPAGRARRLTKCHFTMTDASTSLGQSILADINSVWNTATPLSSFYPT